MLMLLTGLIFVVGFPLAYFLSEWGARWISERPHNRRRP